MISDISPRVIDDFFEAADFEEIADLLQNTHWKFGWGSNSVGESLLHWNKHFAGGGKSSILPCDDALFSAQEAQPIAKAWRLIKEHFLPSHSLIRCYANAQTFGLDGTIHRDNPPDMNATTTIVYCHRLWPLPWGGETTFYTDDGSNNIFSVFPKPGRIITFPGSVLHSAKSPARICRELRISLVFKSIKNL